MATERVKVRRVIEYEGDPEWVAQTLAASIGSDEVPNPYVVAGNSITVVSSAIVPPEEKTDAAPETEADAAAIRPGQGSEGQGWRGPANADDPRLHVGDDDEVP